MNSNELVSIVIPTYERTHSLRRAILSVLHQTYYNIEIIVVDDNQSMVIRNEVENIVKSFEDLRIHLICNKINLGGALSRNEGIKAAKGEYIAFLDDDDEYLPDKVQEQYKLFINSKDQKLALVYGYCLEVGKNNHRKEYRYDYRGACIFDAMIDSIAATSQWMCKKSALKYVDMFSDVPCKQDSLLVLKLLIAGYTVDRVPKIISIYHTDEENRISSNNHQKRIYGEEMLRQVCRENFDKISEKQILEVEYSFSCRLVEHYFALGKKNDFKEALLCVLKYPFRKKSMKVYKHLFIVIQESIYNRRRNVR